MTVGDRIRKIRDKTGLTQTGFGELVGLEQRTISDYERGVSQPGVGRLYLIAEKFNVNPEWLINGVGEPYKQSEVDAATKERIEREHIRRLFSELSPKTQEIILDVLREHVGMAHVKNNAAVNGDVSGDVIINQE